MEAMKASYESQVKALSEQLEELTSGRITEESARKCAEDEMSKLRDENGRMMKVRVFLIVPCIPPQEIQINPIFISFHYVPFFSHV